jgi:hypothetical protein
MILDDNLLAVWFVTLPNSLPEADYLASLTRLPDGKLKLEYRFRYYVDNRAHDSADRKRWHSSITDRSVTEVIAMCSGVARSLAATSGGEWWELLRGTKSFETFRDELLMMPFVHVKTEPMPPPGQA